MRLSTERDRDDARGVAVLHAAFDAGIRLLDTADAYCWDDEDRGHNERLIARAIATWSGDRSGLRVGTKVGLTRPGGRWEPDGRARHLREACEASLKALGAERLDLCQLHAIDPRTPLATSVRALDQLKREGLIASIGLCNVTLGQLDEARRITEIDAVQVELSVWHDEHFLSGIVDHCITNSLRLFAHRPLGGPSRLRRTASDPTLVAIAARHAATPFEIALAWLMDISDVIVPIPGATRVETVASIARAGHIVLTDDDRADLDRRMPAALFCQRRTGAAVPSARATRADGDVVIVMGMPAAGKSTVAMRMVDAGYTRLNRDLAGGTLRGLLPALDRAVEAGDTRIVLDNTYASRRSRAEVIRAAAAHGLPVRCVWLSTSLEDAQTNAAWRIVSRYGRLPGDDELARLRKMDVSVFLPSAQFKYRRDFEPPDESEGFWRVDVEPFVRRHEPDFVNRAVIVSCDDADDLARLAVTLRGYQDAGYRLLGISWQPGVGQGTRSQDVMDAFARRSDELGLEVDVQFCRHAAGPPKCWCRKPLPGLGVLLVSRYQLDPTQCIYLGSGPHDAGFARRLGFRFVSQP